MLSDISYSNLAILGATICLSSAMIIRRLQRGPMRTYNVDLRGQVVVITGCSAGIGKETAREIAQTNATIIFACRNEQKTRKVIAQIQKETKNQNLVFMKLDLQDYNSVKEFSIAFHQQYKKLNILINNAGMVVLDIQKDIEGHDLTFKTNHMAHFLLTHLLMDLIISTKQSRIINVSSHGHTQIKNKVDFEKAYNGGYDGLLETYGVSKYANVLFSNQLQKIFDEKSIDTKAVSLHPGIVVTEMWDKIIPQNYVKFFLKPLSIVLKQFALQAKEGSWTTSYTALQPYEELKPAGYYQKNNLSKHSEFVQKLDQGKELWDFSLKQLNVKSII